MIELVGWILLFLASGVATPIAITLLRYHGAPRPQTLWYLFPLYLGNILAGAFAPRVSWPDWANASRLFVLDLGGQALANAGLLFCGGPLFATFYASVNVWTAFSAVVFAPPTSHPTQRQWLAILLI